MRPFFQPANRFHFDVALAGEKIIILLNGARAEPSFPKRSTVFIAAIKVLYIALAKALHETLFPVSKCVSLSLFCWNIPATIQINIVVLFGKKTGLAIISTLKDM